MTLRISSLGELCIRSPIMGSYLVFLNITTIFVSIFNHTDTAI